MRDAKGQPTGRSLKRLPRARRQTPDRVTSGCQKSTLGMIRDLNRAGLTTFGVAGCDADLIGTYRKWAAEGKLNVRRSVSTASASATPQSRSSVRFHASRRSSCSRATTGRKISLRRERIRPLHDPISFVSRIRSRNSSHSGARSRDEIARTVCLYTCTQPHRHDRWLSRSD